MPFFLHAGRLQHFAHVPKCGGTSVEKALETRFGPLAFFDGEHFRRDPVRRFARSSPQHMTAEVTELYIPRHFRGSSFALVRHPLSRFISAYHHAQRRGRLPACVTPESWLSEFRKTQHLRPSMTTIYDRLQNSFSPTLKYFALKMDCNQSVIGFTATTALSWNSVISQVILTILYSNRNKGQSAKSFAIWLINSIRRIL